MLRYFWCLSCLFTTLRSAIACQSSLLPLLSQRGPEQDALASRLGPGIRIGPLSSRASTHVSAAQQLSCKTWDESCAWHNSDADSSLHWHRGDGAVSSSTFSMSQANTDNPVHSFTSTTLLTPPLGRAESPTAVVVTEPGDGDEAWLLSDSLVCIRSDGPLRFKSSHFQHNSSSNSNSRVVNL